MNFSNEKCKFGIQWVTIVQTVCRWPNCTTDNLAADGKTTHLSEKYHCKCPKFIIFLAKGPNGAKKVGLFRPLAAHSLTALQIT